MLNDKEKTDVNKFVKWFNNSALVSFLFTSWRIKRYFRICQRLRICESCLTIDKNVHWSKADHMKDGRMVYSHTWLCDTCFHPMFEYSPDRTTESWLLQKSK